MPDVTVDSHRKHFELKVPDADVLIHTGDFCKWNTRQVQSQSQRRTLTIISSKKDVVEFNKWLGTLPHKHKLVVGGNHDVSCLAVRLLVTFCTEQRPLESEEASHAAKQLTNAVYLQDSGERCLIPVLLD